MSHLVLVRHGESQSNRDGRFAGWRDVALTDLGRSQASAAGLELGRAGLCFDAVYTSMLSRAIETADLLLEALGATTIWRREHWRLNERHTGVMQGMSKAEAKKEFGREQARAYRRSWDLGPPPVEAGSADDPASDRRYAHCDGELPRGEAMRDVVMRLQPFVDDELSPRLRRGENVLLVGHGQALRALARPFEAIVEPRLPEWKLGSAAPRWYRLDGSLRVVETVLLGGGDAPGE